MTRADLDQQLGRLVVLKGMPGDTDEYFSALADVPIELLAEAVSHAVKTRAWFPVPAELRMDCDAVAAHRTIAPVYPQEVALPQPRVMVLTNPLNPDLSLKIAITREWRHDCDACSDTGWASIDCTGHSCGRRFAHGPHAFVEPCSCRDWNPTIRRHREASAKYAHAPEKVSA